MSIFVRLPLPPSVNSAYRNARGRGRVLTRSASEWKEAAGWEVQLARLKPITGPYRFTILVPEKMRGDVSNRIKLAEDLMVSMGVTPDDRHAVYSAAERSEDVEPGRCIVMIEGVKHGASD